MFDLIQCGKNARAAQAALAIASSKTKDMALTIFAGRLHEGARAVLAANAQDLAGAKENGMSEAMLDRLSLDSARIEGICSAVRKLTAEEDPVGRMTGGSTLANGLVLTKVTVPIGVIAVIYEARPNVTADAAVLCLKAGSCVILKGGREALRTNKAIADILRAALAEAGLPEDCVQLITDNSRETAAALMRLDEYVDLLIPRGGAGLIRACRKDASVPVLETGVGNCHVYVDKSADLTMAADIVENAKTSRVSVCNACESLLIHRDIAEDALLIIGHRLGLHNVQIRGDEITCAVIPTAVPACEDDWGKEYLDYIISVKVVSDLNEAIEHIAKYSTHHSETIVTADYEAAEEFTRRVDSAAVYVNASTRFTDGGEFGFGAEIGISTGRLHARGPVGLKELVSYKYIVRGNGQVR